MPDLNLPILDGTASQGDALRRMAGAGGAAVRSDDGFRLVTARQVIAATGEAPIGILADIIGFPPERIGGILGDDDDFVHIEPDPQEMPQFEVPAGYKQCTGNANHTYGIDSPHTTCPRDSHPLVVVYFD